MRPDREYESLLESVADGAEIDWAALDATARVTAYVRQRLLEYVASYRDRGNAAMVV